MLPDDERYTDDELYKYAGGDRFTPIEAEKYAVRITLPKVDELIAFYEEHWNAANAVEFGEDFELDQDQDIVGGILSDLRALKHRHQRAQEAEEEGNKRVKV